MRYEINSVASQNQASHLLVTLLDVMERARRAPTLLESFEVLFTAHWRALRLLLYTIRRAFSFAAACGAFVWSAADARHELNEQTRCAHSCVQ
jgi:hypothetical protein